MKEGERRVGGAFAGPAEGAGGVGSQPRHPRCLHQRPLRRPPDGQTDHGCASVLCAQQVFDKDTFSMEDAMGHAEFDI
ncbi:hypothetical protein Cni_G06526 [Canna indica]|uniref:Uncharacterized protein n=1 Tax=Canna indica TaxID=4628 RepID=A0AAQ3JX55_9LILI|nr:hypothetical protein Cni_G06526 [Canna indica]